MADFPSFIKTRNVSIGGAIALESAIKLRVKIRVTSSKSLVWNATGYRLERVGYDATSELGDEIVFPLPRTDVPGYRDPATNSMIDVSADGSYTHTYSLILSFVDESGVARGTSVTIGPFTVPEGSTTLDLDKTVVTGTMAGGQVSIPDTWSDQIAAAAEYAAQVAASVDSVSTYARSIVNDAIVQADIPGQVAEAYADDPAVVAAAAALAQSDAGLIRNTDSRVFVWLPPESGFLWAVTDSMGKAVIAARTDGSVIIPAIELGAGTVTFDSLSAIVQAGLFQSFPLEAGPIWSVTDSAGKQLVYIDPDGTFYAPKLGSPVYSGRIAADSVYTAEPYVDANGVNQIVVRRISDGKVTINTTGNSARVEPYLDGQGRLIYTLIQNGISTRAWSPAAGPVSDSPFRPGRTLDQIGDSLTENGYTWMSSRLANSLGITVRNLGMGGQDAARIAGRVAAEPVTVTFSTAIPASGAASVSSVVPDIVQAAGSATRPVVGSITTDDGSVIAGTLSKAGSNGAITFTRSIAGVEKVVTGARPFVSAYDAVNSMTIWVGRNNNLAADADDVRAKIAAIVAKQRAYVKQFAVISVLPLSAEIAGSAGRAALDAFNASLASLYPNNYIDLAEYLTSAQALTDAGVTSPTSQDQADLANKVMPASLRSDDRHINEIAYYAVVDNRLIPFFNSKGWYI